MHDQEYDPSWPITPERERIFAEWFASASEHERAQVAFQAKYAINVAYGRLSTVQPRGE